MEPIVVVERELECSGCRLESFKCALDLRDKLILEGRHVFGYITCHAPRGYVEAVYYTDNGTPLRTGERYVAFNPITKKVDRGERGTLPLTTFYKTDVFPKLSKGDPA